MICQGRLDPQKDRLTTKTGFVGEKVKVKRRREERKTENRLMCKENNGQASWEVLEGLVNGVRRTFMRTWQANEWFLWQERARHKKGKEQKRIMRGQVRNTGRRTNIDYTCRCKRGTGGKSSPVFAYVSACKREGAP